jgi:hypothetical protein
MTKKCTKCGVEKDLGEFYRKKRYKDGLSYWCKKCSNIYISLWKKNHPEKIKEFQKKYYKNHVEEEKKRGRIWRKNNPEKHKAKCKLWYKNNRDRKIKYDCEYQTNKRKIDVKFRLSSNVSSSIINRLRRRLLNKNGQVTFSFLPYTIDDLMEHLESQFLPWMNWKNYGNGIGRWNIDHIKPDCLFNYKSVDDKEFQECWALSNLRPLEWMENIKKGKSIVDSSNHQRKMFIF